MSRLPDAPPLSRTGLRVLAGILLAAVALQVAVRLAAGISLDTASYTSVYHALTTQLLHVYSLVNGPLPGSPGLYQFQWPYLPGYFGWVLLAGLVVGPDGPLFDWVLKVPPVLAVLLTALVVQDFLGRLGSSQQRRLVAAALVALGPMAVLVGYDGQIDGLAILPALAGVLHWTSTDSRRRAVVAGLLIGVGVLVKTVPVLAVLALLPSARDTRERLALLGWTAGPAIAGLLPFLLADPGGVLALRHYAGVPGFGGPSLVIQPTLMRFWLAGTAVAPSQPTVWLALHGSQVTAGALLVLTGVMWRRRTDPATAALMVWLTMFAFGPSTAPLYLCWGLPFLLTAGHLRWAAAAQLLVALPGALLYTHLRIPHATAVYVALMGVFWLTSAGALAYLWWRLVSGGRGGYHPQRIGRPGVDTG
ncbi:MAG: hypothetical protein QOK05_2997 [Chloroflexota bacterium]|nr:hypothetical protein [Chloroflexota bacterium]